MSNTRDFRATQVRTHAIIGSGSSPQLLMYPSASATNQYGGVDLPGTGSDAWMFVSGAIGSSSGKVVFGGDVIISGSISAIGGGTAGTNFFSSTTTGAIFTTGSLAVRGGESSVDAASDKGADVFFYVSGTVGGAAASSKKAVFGGDTVISGSVVIRSNQISGSAGGNITLQSTGIVVAGITGSNASISGNMTVGGGYGSSGITLSSAGVIQADGDLTVEGNTTIGGNLTVNGTTTTVNTTNLLVEDPIVLIGSGAVGTNRNGGIALASGSSVTDNSLVFGRVANDTWGAGRKDVTNGIVTTLADMTLVGMRAGKLEIGGSTAYLTGTTGGTTIGVMGSDLVLSNNKVFLSGSIEQGFKSLTTSNYAVAMGLFTTASSVYAHAQGQSTVALAQGSHAEGLSTVASGTYSHAEGIGTIASGSGQLVIGKYNKRGDDSSLFVIGNGAGDANANRSDVFRVLSGSSINSGIVEVTGSFISPRISGSHTSLADGRSFLVAGSNVTIASASDGQITISSTGGGGSSIGLSGSIQWSNGSGGFVGSEYLSWNEGNRSFGHGDVDKYTLPAPFGYGSHIEGSSTFSPGTYSHAEGVSTAAGAQFFVADSMTTGTIRLSSSYGDVSTAFGSGLIIAKGDGFFLQRMLAVVDAYYASFDGTNTVIDLWPASSETISSPFYVVDPFQLTDGNINVEGAHSEGYFTRVFGNYAHAEGYFATAVGSGSHAEGGFTVAAATYSHTEGRYTLASATAAHSEGLFTTGSGIASHAEGSGSIALGNFSHAEGHQSIASGTYSHAGGIFTIASGSGQTVYGKYNLRGNTSSLFVIGNGAGDANANRSDVVRVETSGLQVTGSLYVTNGISGSHTTLADGRSFLVAGTNVTIVSASDGQITISSTGGGGGDTFFSSVTAGEVFTTGSIVSSGSLSVKDGSGNSVFSASTGGLINARRFQLSGSSGITGSLVIQDDLTSVALLTLSSSAGSATLNETSAGDFEIRNTKLGGNMTLGVKTSAGNAVNFMTVRPNGAAVSTLVSILPSIYAGPANPVNSTDTNFFVGGTVGSRGGSNRGAGVFGGDLVISGSAHILTGISVTGSIAITGNIMPDADRTQDLGSPSMRWANVYTGDLHLRNDRGDYTLIEEEDFLSIRFNKTGKRYRFLLEPVPELDEDPKTLL
jgi:hypothetical protein